MAMQPNDIQVQIGDEVKVLEGAELTEFNEMRAQIEAEAKAFRDAAEAEAKVKAEAKQALLDKLGITADEAKLLLG